MKFKSPVIILSVCLSILCSCSKREAAENISVTGKWRLIEVYSGYANGGNFRWNTVAYENGHSLEFATDGRYKRRENAGINFPECAGTFELHPDMSLDVNSTCENARMKISELTNGTLIIDYQVREGVIRYKYAAER